MYLAIEGVRKGNVVLNSVSGLYNDKNVDQ